MAVRSTMAALIASVRLLINDPAGTGQTFADQDIQDVFDESRVDIKNAALIPKPTFTGNSIQYLDYWSDYGGWEDGTVLKQFLNVIVTPATLEPIAGHWTFTATTLPPVYISGTLHDRYRAAADLLERMSAKWATAYNVTVDGQSLQRSGAHSMLLDLAHTYRAKQRPSQLFVMRSDLSQPGRALDAGLGPLEIDYMGSG